MHLLGDLGLHLAERGGLLFHLLEPALHLVELLQLHTRGVSTAARVSATKKRRRQVKGCRASGYLGGVVAGGHVDVLAVDGDLLAVHLVLLVLHGRRAPRASLGC